MREYDLILFYQIGSYKTYIFVNTHAGSTPIGNRATYNDAVGFPVECVDKKYNYHCPTVYTDRKINLPRLPAMVIPEANLPRSIRYRFQEWQEERRSKQKR